MRHFLTSLHISSVFHDTYDVCCVHNTCGCWRKLCFFYLATFQRLSILSSSILLLLHSSIPYILHSGQCLHFYQNYSSSDCTIFPWNSSSSSYVWLFRLFLWMTGELVRTSLWRLPFTIDGSEFDNFGGGEIFMRILIDFSSWETWMDVDGRTDAGLKVCHLKRLFHT